MTNLYTYPAAVGGPQPAGIPHFGGPPSAMPPAAPPWGVQKKPRPRLLIGVAIGAVVAAFAAGLLGAVVGTHLNGPSTPTPAAQPTTTTPVPSSAQVRSATIDLCTRFAAGYRAMPSPQNSAADVIPSLNYIADALRDNPIADSKIRNAVAESLRLARDQASELIRERSSGAVQPSTTWNVELANAADQHVWDLCRSYAG